MRLLHAKTKKIEEFFENATPKYAILSHTWGQHEVTFQDFQHERYQGGSIKIDGCCEQAITDGLDYVWIDTCCIDKGSSAELSEAINSMFAWYTEAHACYAYLVDVPSGQNPSEPDSPFIKSRWFTRGWTLQELIAPRRVSFYTQSWDLLGIKGDSEGEKPFTTLISQITGIPYVVLGDPDSEFYLRLASVAQKMSWAAGRQTTRKEDVAYSLLGIFGVNMPMLYGERERAFVRLQEEIMKRSDDQSLFAWGFRDFPSEVGLLAKSPSNFANCQDVVSYIPPGSTTSHFSMTNAGLHIEMRLRALSNGINASVGLLHCTTVGERGSKTMALSLTEPREDDSDWNLSSSSTSGTYSRIPRSPPILMPISLFEEQPKRPIYVHPGLGYWAKGIYSGLTVESQVFGEDATLNFVEVYPQSWAGIAYGGSIDQQKCNLLRQRQEIFLHCQNEDEGQSFVLHLDYVFDLDLEDDAADSLLPRSLNYSATHIDSKMSLAEVMIRFVGETGDALDWRQGLDFVGGERLTLNLDTESDDANWVLNVDICEATPTETDS